MNEQDLSPEAKAWLRDLVDFERRTAPARLAWGEQVAQVVLYDGVDETELSPVAFAELKEERIAWIFVCGLDREDPAERWRTLVLTAHRQWLKHRWMRLRTIAEAMDPAPESARLT